MRISLIGMAGSGKSFWSKRLAEEGFKRFCCDDMIADRLEQELTRADGSRMEMGEWMGLPYEPGYKEREAKYLAHEIEVLTEILESLEAGVVNPREDVVIDTTGSVIYTGEGLLQRLRSCTTVVLLSTPPDQQQSMLQAYLAKPGPVLWRDHFTKGLHESNEEALARCYPRLLASRERLYERYAEITIEYERHRREGFGTKEFLSFIKEKLKAC